MLRIQCFTSLMANLRMVGHTWSFLFCFSVIKEVSNQAQPLIKSSNQLCLKIPWFFWRQNSKTYYKTYVETTTTGPQSESCLHFSTIFISSTKALVEVGTLWPWGQHINWNSWQVLVGALTPAINSVKETICKYFNILEQ